MLVQQIVVSRTFLKFLTFLALGYSFISSTRYSFLCVGRKKVPKDCYQSSSTRKCHLDILPCWSQMWFMTLTAGKAAFDSMHSDFWHLGRYTAERRCSCLMQLGSRESCIFYMKCVQELGFTFNLWYLGKHCINSLCCLESLLDYPDQSCKGRFLLAGARYFICVRSSALVLWFQIRPSFKSSYTMKYTTVRSLSLKHTFRT